MKTISEKEILEIQGTDVRYVSRAQLSCLSGAQLSGLSGAQLSGLSRAQLESLDVIKNAPTLKNPYTQILSKIQGDGKLEMKNWHTCETTHCVGGWTVFLTPGGKELEAKFDTATAARIILSASRPGAPLPNFTASNEAAMAFIEARAKEESVATK